MTVLTVGSIAFDSIETPTAKKDKMLGGSASYASLASRIFAPSAILGVVGADFPQEYSQMFASEGIDTQGLVVVDDGKTFHWAGKYHADMNNRDTLMTELNVLATHHPDVPEPLQSAEYLFLANTDPELQMVTLSQCSNTRLVLADTMNLWINTKLEALWKLIAKVDVLLINDSEAEMLCGTTNLVVASRKILECGTKRVIIKKGAHGSLMFTKDSTFLAPAYPLAKVIDPTGAGDSFAGAYLGYLAQCSTLEESAHRRALIVGTAVASFNCEEFSVDGLRRLTRDDVVKRCEEIHQLTQFDTVI